MLCALHPLMTLLKLFKRYLASLSQNITTRLCLPPSKLIPLLRSQLLLSTQRPASTPLFRNEKLLWPLKFCAVFHFHNHFMLNCYVVGETALTSTSTSPPSHKCFLRTQVVHIEPSHEFINSYNLLRNQIWLLGPGQN